MIGLAAQVRRYRVDDGAPGGEVGDGLIVEPQRSEHLGVVLTLERSEAGVRQLADGTGLITAPEHREVVVSLEQIDDEPLRLRKYRRELGSAGVAPLELLDVDELAQLEESGRVRQYLEGVQDAVPGGCSS